ncbi:hypothetical protein ACEUCP_07885 [Aeromonas caviae]|uniref:phage head spike fiber domain-containing protein n=1 Tax=Aeromonas caviae TaxID=648 RepID=UPI0038D1ACB5
MAGVWKRDGTVAVTNGNKKVTGTGTTFADTKNGVAKGHLFCITSGTSVDFYEVDYVVSNTELYLVQSYRGSTATGKAYEIITTFSDSVPEFARRLTATLSAYQQQSDAFQALLTSTATTVEVTAPDGTKQTLIPWKRVTSEGEGQAARAKTEADKAAASAALAGDIVAASALPLPDVWAPLSDSLRMITGYGREVKVGEDVVSQMVNFSRNSTATYIGKNGLLKTAAVNEPRFEKEGLLIEGQSTNLITTQSFSSTSMVTVTPNQPSPDGANNAQKIESISNPALTKNFIATASVLTASWFFKMDGNGALDVVIRNNTTSTNLMSTTITVTNGVATAANPSLSKLIPIKDGWYRHSFTQETGIAAGDAITVYFGLPGGMTPGRTFTLFGVQAEALPFASSYIPTNGAAVTRAADQAWIPALGNMTPIGFSVSAEFDTLRGSVSGLMDNGCVVSMEQENKARMAVIRGKYAGTDADFGFSTHCGAFGQAGYVTAILRSFNVKDRKGTVAVSEGGGLLKMRVNSSVTSVSSATATVAPLPNTIRVGAFGDAGSFSLFGHVRNLRIWHRTLTDDQLKAVA